MGISVRVAALFVLLAAASRAAQETRKTLSPKEFETLHALIRPHAGDTNWFHIPWVDNRSLAREKAARENKPILYVIGGGAGYGNPLGVC